MSSRHKLRVHRKGFHVKATVFRRKGKTVHRSSFYVTPSTFSIKDRGAPGRGPKVIPALKKGGLGGAGYFKKSTATRRRLIVKLAKKQGEKTIGGRLQAVAVFNKRVNPSLAAKARMDRKYLMGTMKGTTVVGYPKGFKRVR